MKEISGCNALLTGASRGIGVSIAKRLAEEGVNLALVARTADALEQVRDEVVNMGVRAIAVPADLSRLNSLKTLVQNVETDLGPIDLLINNAAIENIAVYETLSPDDIKKAIDLNLLAPMILTRSVLPGMVARDRGHIVNISSADGLLPLPFCEVYAATKHGLLGFTYSLHLTFRLRKSSLGASAICPGVVGDVGMYQRAVDTHGKKVEVSPFLGFSSPEEVADSVIRAIQRDKTIVTVGRFILPLHLLLFSVPRITEWVATRSGWFEPLRYLVKSRDHRNNSDFRMG